MGNLLCFVFGLVCSFVFCSFVFCFAKVLLIFVLKETKFSLLNLRFVQKNYRMLKKKYLELSQRIERNKRDLAIDDSTGSKISKCFLGTCAT